MGDTIPEQELHSVDSYAFSYSNDFYIKNNKPKNFNNIKNVLFLNRGENECCTDLNTESQEDLGWENFAKSKLGFGNLYD